MRPHLPALISLLALYSTSSSAGDAPPCPAKLEEAQTQSKTAQYLIQVLSEERGRAQFTAASLSVQIDGLKAENEFLKKEIERLKTLRPLQPAAQNKEDK